MTGPEMCPACYRSIDSHTMRERRICQGRDPIDRPPRPRPARGLPELRCKTCGRTIERSGQRGRPPSYCPPCKAAR